MPKFTSPVNPTGNIRFVKTLPAVKRTNGRGTWHKKFALALMMNPEKWAVVIQTKSRSQASYYKDLFSKGKSEAFTPRGTFIAATRKSASGVYTVYAKYQGIEAV